MKILPSEDRCVRRVVGMWHSSQCERRGVIERDGELYCKQHDPEAIKARRAVAKARDELQEAVWRADFAVMELRDDVVASVLAAKESALPASVAKVRRALLDARDVAKNARAALGVKP